MPNHKVVRFFERIRFLVSFRRKEGELRRLGGFSSPAVVARLQQIPQPSEQDLVLIKGLKVVEE